jgi:aminoglycoside phosphotransferase (APT) family kinase protein
VPGRRRAVADGIDIRVSKDEGLTVDVAALTSYLARLFGQPVEVLEVKGLGEAPAGDVKAFGYGVPFAVRCRVGDTTRELVVARTKPVQGFGHDHPADRAWQALYAHVAYNDFPRHVRSLDVGFRRASGELVSAGDSTEFFQVVEFAEGTPYWRDLERLLDVPVEEQDLARAEALARFLADVHREKRDEPTLWQRRIRELVGHGECLMGILDSYPHPYEPLPPTTCEAIERAAVGWRWRLRTRAQRLSRVHGDFHPWNLLFRTGTDFSVLDRSRGEWGEPADDVAALAINYLFFGLRRRAATGDVEPFLTLFRIFLETYLKASGDTDLCKLMPPFLAFRALVIAHPRWYPTIARETRAALISFARCMMDDCLFDPSDVKALFGVAT